MTTVETFYRAIAALAPFEMQDSYDNSGLLVGGLAQLVQRALVALDCSTAVVEEAVRRDCQLIVSHHPLIFTPLRALEPAHPVTLLARHEIALISTHTPLDKAPTGVNATLRDLLTAPLGLTGEPTVLDGGYGMAFDASTNLTPAQMADVLRQTLCCGVVRFSAGERPMHKIGFACGAGGSILEEAWALGCDAFITGDVKHDRWYYAKSRGMSLFDCGHYHLEHPAMLRLRDNLAARISDAEILLSEADGDPTMYCI